VAGYGGHDGVCTTTTPEHDGDLVSDEMSRSHAVGCDYESHAEKLGGCEAAVCCGERGRTSRLGSSLY
jgi:hypothetical protein